MPNTKTKPQPTEPVEPVVRFKMLRNVMLFDLSPYMGGSHPAIPMQMKEERSIQVPAYVEEPTSDGYTRMRMGTKSPVQPTFDLSHTFTIPLEPIDPRPIVKTEGMSEAWFEKLQDREYERALASRERQENLRRLLKHYAKQPFPTIEIVDDPTGFVEQTPFYSDVEFAAIRERANDAKFAAGSK